MSNCLSAKTTKNLPRPCAPPSAGVRSIFYVGFLSQLLSVSRAVGDDLTITALVLKNGEKLTKIEGYKTSNDFSVELNVTEYATYSPHVGTFTVFDQSSSGLKQINILKSVEDMFVIVRQNGLAGNWRVLGINAGMQCTAATNRFNDPNGGAKNMTFRADQEVTEPEILKHITNSLDDTDTYLASLAYDDV